MSLSIIITSKDSTQTEKMQKTLDEVFNLIQPEILKFREEYDKIIVSDVKLLKQILKFLFKKKGKQIRPLYVILSAGIVGNINDVTYRGAALIELLHTATLVHDDVVDEAEKRRGVFTINALWKNKIAVLVGDYLLAKGLQIALDNNYFEMLKLVSNATKLLSEGELLQFQVSRNWKIDEKIYYEIITKKTASLFATCFQLGGMSVDADETTQKKLYNLGLNIGIAFQLKDDILDLQSNKNKNAFSDIKDKKLTLPLIHAMNNSTILEKKKFALKIKNFKKNPTDSEAIVAWLNSKGSIAYTNDAIHNYLEKAKNLLNELPQNQYNQIVKDTINFHITRNY